MALAEAVGADVKALGAASGGGATGADTALRAEVEAARGWRDSLGERLGVISNFASPNAGGVIVGGFYDASFHGAAASTAAGAAGWLEVSPYYTSVGVRVDMIGVVVSTLVAAATARVVIYAAGADGWPSDLLYESAALDLSTTGYKSVSLDHTFEAGTQYWIGVHHSSTATLRGITQGSLPGLGLGTTSSATSYATVLRRTQTYASLAPTTWGTVSAAQMISNAVMPSVRWRVAEVLAPPVVAPGPGVSPQPLYVFEPVAVGDARPTLPTGTRLMWVFATRPTNMAAGDLHLAPAL